MKSDGRIADYWKTGVKACTRCKEVKLLSEFNFCSNPNGRRNTPASRCKPCAVEYHREWRLRSATARASIIESTRKWREINPHKKREMQRAREARKRNQFIEHVDVYVLFSRDEGKCGICGLDVPLEEVSVDHIIPISKGGEHSYANVQISHLRCNVLKSNRVTEEVK